MKAINQLCAMLLCLLLVISMGTYALAENTITEVKLQLPAEADVLSLSAKGDSITVVYENDRMVHVAVFDDKGTFVCEVYQSADVVSAGFLDSGKLAVANTDTLEIWDIQSNTKVCAYPMEEGAIWDADGQAVWYTETIEKNNELDVSTTYIAKAVRVTADGIQTVLELPDNVTALLYAQYPYLYYEKEIPEYKRVICRINADTLESTDFSDWVRGKNMAMGHVTGLFQSEILMPWEQPDYMFVANHTQIIARDGATLLLQGEGNVSVVDANTQTLLAQVPCEGADIHGAVNEEKNSFVLADASSAMVYHWSGEGTSTDMAEMIDIANISDAIRAQREALLSMHGIMVTEDETVVEKEYMPKALNSELRAYVAGIELTNFFQLFPQGMTDEMRPAGIQTFPVCLTGYMTCVGLSIPYDVQYYMALDVNFLYDAFIYNDPAEEETSPMIDTFPHEFMHMLEYRLTQTMLPDGEPILSLWDTAVPPEENKTFAGTYEGDWDARNSLDGADPAEDIWFEGAYARTMPEEDRATLYACLISGVHENGEGWDVYPHLLEKGQLLCAMIRETYPSIQATPEGSMYWERNFEQLPISSFLTQK